MIDVRPVRRGRVTLFGVLIETERLSLRPMTIDDLDQFVALPYVAPPFDRDQAIERLHADEREWKDRGHGMLAILERGSGRFLGRVALKYWAQSDETWFGSALYRDAWGHGFATEAGHACIDWGFRDLGVPCVSAMIHPENTRSIKLVERLGMTPLRAEVLLEDSVLVYGITREEWQAASSDRTAVPGRP
jgi:RimJ/RimL family protein N-acetyltransferase